MTEVVIAGAARTPVGAFNGSLSSVPAHELAKIAIIEALARAKTEADRVQLENLKTLLTEAARPAA